MQSPDAPSPAKPLNVGDQRLLAALLDGMDAALCAFDSDGVVTHWNGEATRLLGWSAQDAVGRRGLAGWAVRGGEGEALMARLLAVMAAPGRQVHEFPLLTKDGGRILVRAQTCAVPGPDGRPAGVYCAFSEIHAQIDLERSMALSDALFQEAVWGVVLIDADLRPAVVNDYAARALRTPKEVLLGRPLGEVLDQGVEEIEGALDHVLSAGTPPPPADLWVRLRTGSGEADRAPRRCWRSGFVRLGSPLGEEPAPLGVGWLFEDVTEAKLAEREASRLRFRTQQLRRAARVAIECADPMDAAVGYLDFALAGFADHVLLDLLDARGRPVRAAGTPGGPGPCLPVGPAGVPVGYPPGHPALQAVERTGSVRARDLTPEQAARHRWPRGTLGALCSVLRSRGRTLGVVTFLRGAGRPVFDHEDAAYAEEVAARVAAALDLLPPP
ncbi:PAS domain-containing protein [Streptantibioticus cattleyicolor]|uniref:Putative PAS/PAC sensor protein n=2 Tax=Streptomycetaceae TaxID=2062 RepID=G8WRZ3_STREN|nr:putative PAS/PAC sensor protein [Streptantibioticus cattleyicolor NRRL 8057 = DSM 46488]